MNVIRVGNANAFLANLIRLGIAMGFWLGIGAVWIGTFTTAICTSIALSLMVTGFIAWDVRKAHQSDPDKEQLND